MLARSPVGARHVDFFDRGTSNFLLASIHVRPYDHFMMPLSTLVIGCSEQIPNEPRAYRFMGTSSQGVVLLSRHGAIYSAAMGEVCGYRELLERMLGLVLRSCPPGGREQARGALIRRWNRDWGVEVEDVDEYDGVPVEPQQAVTVGASASSVC